MSTRGGAFSGSVTASLALVLAAGGLGAWAKIGGLSRPETSELSRSLSDMRKVRVPCGQARPYSGVLNPRTDCDWPAGGSPALLVWGDSHASHLMPMAAAFAARHNLAVRIRYMPECPPAQNYSLQLIGILRSPGCEEFNRDVLDEIAALKKGGLQGVLISARWSAYARNPQADRALEQGLRSTLAAVQRLGMRVLVVAPGPDFPHVVPACLARRKVVECGMSREAAENARMPVMALIMRVANEFPGARIADPMAALCSVAYCSPIKNGEILFSDGHHLSEKGSLALLGVFGSPLAWTLGSPADTKRLVGAAR